jgi:hypothetical protein
VHVTYHSGVNDTAVLKIGDFIVDFLREFEAIFKKALTRVSGALEVLIFEKKQRSRISCQGPFKQGFIRLTISFP